MPTVTAPAGIRSTILVVEDEAGIARMVQVLLEARGFSTIVTHSGSEALQRLADHPVDLVLLDVMMPGMDGYEVCRRLKADERWRHLPVVMLTAKDTSRDMVLGLEIGADDYITKPFNTDELIARIKVLLRVRGMSQEVMRRNRELRALNAVALAVNRSLGLEEILDGALAGVMESLGLACGLIHLSEPGGGGPWCFGHGEASAGPPRRVCEPCRRAAVGGGRPLRGKSRRSWRTRPASRSSACRRATPRSLSG